jgi:hypothetical protein
MVLAVVQAAPAKAMRTRFFLTLPVACTTIVAAATGVVWAAPQPSAPSTVMVQPMDEQSEFEKGRNAYRAQKYDEADARFFQMLDPKTGTLHDKVLIKQARMYWAATALAEHHEKEAVRLFQTILIEDHDYEPDPLAFPTEVVNAFIDTKANLAKQLEEIAREQYRLAAERRAHEEAIKQHEAARLKMLEKLAGEVEVTRKHSRWVALLPGGTGQFQNGERALAWFFAATESALLVCGIATVPVYYVDLANTKSTFASSSSIAQQYLDRANAARDVNLACYGALALTSVIGAIQAEVAFVPQVLKTEPRAVPDVPMPAPPTTTSLSTPALHFSLGAAPLPGRDARGVGGASLGVTVRF